MKKPNILLRDNQQSKQLFTNYNFTVKILYLIHWSTQLGKQRMIATPERRNQQNHLKKKQKRLKIKRNPIGKMR